MKAMDSYESTGRVQQKARTRDHLVATVRDLIAAGEDPSIEEVAAAAGVSPTTTYRYFPNRQALLAAAHPQFDRTTLLDDPAPRHPRERLESVLDAHLHILREWEPQLRASLRASLTPGSPPPALRRGRAVAWLEDALSPLGASAAHSLAVAVRACAGIEPYVWLRDVAGRSPEESVAIMRTNALAIYDQYCART